ncbi:tubulin folding cofactor A [Exophiala xenobiotica]|uniref:Tubulin-specific chaperone A n=1 Tax=Lithohypha guttulata TaxID=1690604 RepID=A0ABR0K8E2_9EURO|nr:tubulin folding cofactor A [Lithohypha guttulata]KAK5328170.1 tubulin folding cofactor A [Exophiala xenobiotica]
MAPSQTKIATSVLQRLLKEEASYHKEAESQKKRISDLEKQNNDQDENRDFKLKQEKRALEETKAIFPSLRERIANAREKLQAQLESTNDEAEIEQAKKVLAEAMEQQKGDPDSAHPSGDAPQ